MSPSNRERLLLAGPPGSGKTSYVLEQVRRILERGGDDFRLIVPTASMSEHLRNQLARDGYVFPAQTVQTLGAFVKRFERNPMRVSRAAFALLLESVLTEKRRRSFGEAAAFPGFRNALASAIEDLVNAGCDALTFAGLRELGVWRGEPLASFLEVFEDVENRLREGGRGLRVPVLLSVARRIREAGCGVSRVFLDGFFTFNRAERDLLSALAAHASIAVTLPEWPGAADCIHSLRLSGFTEKRFFARRTEPQRRYIEAASMAQEVTAIAAELRRQHDMGRRWREMGIVVRAEEPYVPALRTALARFEIPARFYFNPSLEKNAAARFLLDVFAALESGWDHEKTLKALLNSATRPGNCPLAPEFEFRVLNETPGQGLEPLLAQARNAGSSAIAECLEVFRKWNELSTGSRPPAEWSALFSGFTDLLQVPGAQGSFDQETIEVWRGRAAAMRAVLRALTEAAEALPVDACDVQRFVECARIAISESTLRVADKRRDAVAVMDVYEARQWELPVVFLCGLLEGEFPRRPKPEALLTAEVRDRLASHGFPVATRFSRFQEEKFLFQVALSRATQVLVLSWPRFDAMGEETLRTLALDADEAAGQPETGRLARPAPVVKPPRVSPPGIFTGILGREVKPVLSPTAIESFLLCPFQYFGRHTLRRREFPEAPGERLDTLKLGSLVHAVLAQWHANPRRSVEEILERDLRQVQVKYRIPDGFQVEAARVALLRHLNAYIRFPDLREGWTVKVEYAIPIRLGDVTMQGKADRVDISPDDRVRVIDFKFTSSAGLKRRMDGHENGRYVQGGLYLHGLQSMGLAPEGFYYLAIRGDNELVGWGQVDVARLMDEARQLTEQAVKRIRAGATAPEPTDPKACRWCELRSACRVQARATVGRAAG